MAASMPVVLTQRTPPIRPGRQSKCASRVQATKVELCKEDTPPVLNVNNIDHPTSSKLVLPIQQARTPLITLPRQMQLKQKNSTTSSPDLASLPPTLGQKFLNPLPFMACLTCLEHFHCLLAARFWHRHQYSPTHLEIQLRMKVFKLRLLSLGITINAPRIPEETLQELKPEILKYQRTRINAHQPHDKQASLLSSEHAISATGLSYLDSVLFGIDSSTPSSPLTLLFPSAFFAGDVPFMIKRVLSTVWHQCFVLSRDVPILSFSCYHSKGPIQSNL
uniref:Uncharacterized protein n=1 Tax=Glossina austeni TaxID=7395 RepID=A0A1A9UM26_GLOAU